MSGAPGTGVVEALLSLFEGGGQIKLTVRQREKVSMAFGVG